MVLQCAAILSCVDVQCTRMLELFILSFGFWISYPRVYFFCCDDHCCQITILNMINSSMNPVLGQDFVYAYIVTSCLFLGQMSRNESNLWLAVSGQIASLQYRSFDWGLCRDLYPNPEFLSARTTWYLSVETDLDNLVCSATSSTVHFNRAIEGAEAQPIASSRWADTTTHSRCLAVRPRIQRRLATSMPTPRFHPR